jgi:hypothetical protein
MSVAKPEEDRVESEVRFMYLTQDASKDPGWANWRSNDNFIQELERVLNGGSYDKEEQKRKITYAQKKFGRDIERIDKLFKNSVTVVTEARKPLCILLDYLCFSYVGIMRNQLHMAFWIVHKEGIDMPRLCCCFLFKSRSQKLSELSFTAEQIDFDFADSSEFQ